MLVVFSGGRGDAISLLSSTLNLNSGYLALEFSSRVQSASLNASAIELLAAASEEDVLSSWYQLTGYIEGVFPITNSSRSVYVMLLQEDYLNILWRSQLSQTAPYIRLKADVVKGVLPPTKSTAYGPVLVSNFVPDAYPPSIVKYALDMNAGMLLVLFDEPMNRSSLDLSRVVIQSASNINDAATSTPLKKQGAKLASLPCHVVFLSSPKPTFAPTTTPVPTWKPTSTKNNGTTPPIATSENMTMAPLTSWTTCVNETTLDDSMWINITLGKANTDLIKSKNPLASTLDQTFLAVSDIGVASDLSGNQATTNFWSAYEGHTPFLWIRDTTPPELDSFSLNIDAGTLTLFFSETIDVSELKVWEIQLQELADASLGGESHVLRGEPDYGSQVAADTSLDTSDVVIALSKSDLNEIKRKARLAVDAESTHISFLGETTFMDTAFPPNYGALGQTQRVAIYKPDVTRPSLVWWRLDLGTREIHLVFDETVTASSLSVLFIGLQTAATYASGVEATQLSGSSHITTSAATNVTISLGPRDFADIKVIDGLGINIEKTYLTIEPKAVADMANNLVFGHSILTALKVNEILPDTSSPLLERWAINMNRGLLLLQFDEPISRASFDRSLIKIRGGLQSDESAVEVSLGRGKLVFADEDEAVVAAAAKQLDLVDIPAPVSKAAVVLLVALDDADILILKAIDGVADSQSTSYLQTEAGWVADYPEGNPNTGFHDVPAYNFTADVTKPNLIEFELNLDAGTLTIVADEPLRYDSINASSFRLTAKANGGGSSVTLSEFSAQTRPWRNWNRIILQLHWEELDAIKIDTAALGDPNEPKYLSHVPSLSFEGGGAVDMAGNVLNAIDARPNSSIPCVATYADLSAPRLLSFDIETFDFNITLRFDEVVRPDTLLADGSWQLQSAAIVTGGAIPLIGFSTTHKTWQRQLVARPDDSTRRMLLERSNVATRQLNTYLRQSQSNGVMDAAGNGMTAMYDAIQLGPSVVSFELDANIGELIVSFSEPINLVSLDPTNFILQSAEVASEAVERIILDADTMANVVRGSNGASIVFTLTANDFATMKLSTKVSRGNQSTWLVAASGAVTDFAYDLDQIGPNSLVESWVTSSSSIRAAAVYPDVTPPLMTACSLDINAEILQLSFDEPVRAASLIASNVILRDAQSDAASTESVTLSKQTTARVDSETLILDLSTTDTAKIKAARTLGRSLNTTYCALRARAVTDGGAGVAPTSIAAMSQAGVVPVSSLTLDVTPPSLSSFVLDLNANKLHLRFDEPVNVSSTRPLDVMMSFANAQTAVAEVFELTCSKTVVNTRFNSSVTISLCSSDIQAILMEAASGGVCASIATCFIFYGSQLTHDAALPPNAALSVDVEYAVQADSIVPDTTPPTLVSFSLDLNAGTITLVANEVIDAMSVVVNALNLQSARFNDAVATRMLAESNGSAISRKLVEDSRNSTSVVIDLGRADLDAIKALSGVGLALDASSVYVSHASDAFRDVSGNQAEEVTVFNALGPASTFTKDTTSPSLLSLSRVSKTRKVLYALFDEPIDHESVNLSQWVLQSGDVSFALDDEKLGVVILEPGIDDDAADPADQNAPYSTTVAIRLADAYADAQALGILTSQDTTALGLGAYAVRDCALLNQNAYAGDLAKANAKYPNTGGARPTIVGPRLEAASLDMDIGVLALSFTEEIETANGNSVNTTAIALQSTSNLAASIDVTTVKLSADSKVVGSATLGDKNDARLYAGQLLTSNETPLGSAHRIIRISLSVEDLWALQRARGKLAKLASATYVSIMASFGSAPSETSLLGNPLSLVETPTDRALPVDTDAFFSDSTPPKLVAYALDLNAGRIELIFSEPVVQKSLNVTAIRLQVDSLDGRVISLGIDSNFDSKDRLGLRGSCDDAAGNWSVACSYAVVNLGPKDFDMVRSSKAGSYLSLDASAAFDTAVPPNRIVPVVSLSVSSFTKDSTPPEITTVLLNLDTGVMILNFSEPVDPLTFNATRVSIRPALHMELHQDYRDVTLSPSINTSTTSMSSTDAPSSVPTSWASLLPSPLPTSVSQLRLRYAQTAQNDGTKSVIVRLRRDLMRLKAHIAMRQSAQGTMDTSLNSTVIDAQENFIRDCAYPSPANPATQFAAAPNILIADSTGPRLLSIDWNRDVTRLEFYFDEPVIATSLNLSALLFVTTANNRTVRLNNSYGTLANRVFIDLPFRVIISLQQGETDALLDLGISMTSQVAASVIHPVGGVAQDVMGRSLAIPGAGPYVVDDNFETLTLAGVMTGLNLVTAMPAGPVVTDFVLNMEMGQLLIEFNHDVSSSSFNASAISIAASDDASAFSHAMTNSSVANLESYGMRGTATVTLLLSIADINALKLADSGRGESPVATRLQNTILSVDASFARSKFGTPSVPRVLGAAILSGVKSVQFHPDISRPLLKRWELNMDSGALVIYMDEPVRARDVHVDKIALYNNSTVRTSTVSVRLSASRTALLNARRPESTPSDSVQRTFDAQVGADTKIKLRLGETDLNELKRLDFFATSVNDTFLGFTAAGAIVDRSSTANSVATTTDELHALAHFSTDRTSPRLDSFDANFETRTLTLHFDEPVVIDTFNASAFTLQERNFVLNGQSYRLTSNSRAMQHGATSSSSQTIVLLLGDDDYARINLKNRLAKSEESSRLQMQSFAAEDIAGNRVDEVFDGQTLTPSIYVSDSTLPEISRFWINVDTSLLTINFTEPVAFGSLDATKFIIDDGNSTALRFSEETTGRTLVNSDLRKNYDDLESTIESTGDDGWLDQDYYGAGSTLSISISKFDLNAIKELESLAISVDTVFLSADNGAISDMSGNPSAAASARACVLYSADVTRPELEAFDLNLESGILLLDFSETVSVSVHPGAIQLMASNSIYEAGVVRLSHEEVQVARGPGGDANMLTVHLGDTNLNALKLAGIGVEKAFISMDSSFVSDQVGLPVVRISSADVVGGNPMAVRFVLPDTTPPWLVRGTYSTRLHSLHLFYNEPVPASKVRPSRFSLDADSQTRMSADILVSDGNLSSEVVLDLDTLCSELICVGANVSISDSTTINSSNTCKTQRTCEADVADSFFGSHDGLHIVAEPGAVTDYAGNPSLALTRIKIRPPNCDCGAGMYIVAECTDTADALCARCSNICPEFHYIASPCSDRADIGCQRCTDCMHRSVVLSLWVLARTFYRARLFVPQVATRILRPSSVRAKPTLFARLALNASSWNTRHHLALPVRIASAYLANWITNAKIHPSSV